MQGSFIEYVYIFLKGRSKVFFTSPNGKTLLVAYYTTTELIGDVELMSNETEASLSVQTISDVECIGIPFSQYKEVLKNNIIFMNHVGEGLSSKLRKNTISNIFNILHSLDARICRHIAMTNVDGYFSEKLTELSEIMGTSYRHLLRTLDKLCVEGVIEKIDRGYKIVDMNMLKSRANDDYNKLTNKRRAK